MCFALGDMSSGPFLIFQCADVLEEQPDEEHWLTFAVFLADLMLEGGELAGLQDAAPPFFLRSAQCRTGLGLLLTYLISDILQVISGMLTCNLYEDFIMT